MAGFARKLRSILIVVGITLLGAVAGVVVGLVLGSTPGMTEFFESGSRGWDGIARAGGLMLMAGGFGLLGMLAGIWMGFRKVLSKDS
ncbi:hypothetical protein [Marinobacter sp. F3R11]|uniref:hypothetical protein n=1 Tax=Marinobacter sp. F3R11 TaxID=2267231 RepID=UPI000DE80FAB|nr:hypothetical protein [Marinobacter sp. F3R11]RBW48975.1 hypothetical protein DS878_12655 [Marinobacter sp. F3R11]